MTHRSYRNLTPAAASEARERIVAAAVNRLGSVPCKPFALETVAADAGVTNRTIYKEFGCRRALLEAVFDEVVRRAGMGRMADAMSEPDAHKALANTVDRFCAVWGGELQVHLRLQAARATDPELDHALNERNERRRLLLKMLVKQLVDTGEVSPESMADLVDVLFVLTSAHVYLELSCGRESRAVRALVRTMVESALVRARQRRSGSPISLPGNAS